MQLCMYALRTVTFVCEAEKLMTEYYDHALLDIYVLPWQNGHAALEDLAGATPRAKRNQNPKSHHRCCVILRYCDHIS